MRAIEVGNNQLQFYPTPAAAWQAMLEDCSLAEVSVDIEQYILWDDEVGAKFLSLLAEKAKAGVAVRMVVDGFGSRAIKRSPLIEQITSNGGKVHFFNPIDGLRMLWPLNWFPRDHSKVMIIDGKVGYTGGVCMAAYMRSWRDLHMRVAGSMVHDMKSDFEAFWKSLVRAPHHYRRRFDRTRTALRYIAKNPILKLNPAYHELLKRIRTARTRICIATPYFLPPYRLRHELVRAVRRGVTVEVLASAVSDTPLVDFVARSFFPRLLARGITIHLYQPNVMHAKYTIIDNNWASVGSMNIDRLSITHNREASIVIRDAAPIEELAQRFRTDVGLSEKATRASWENLPWYNKLFGIVGRLFRRVM